MRKADKNRLERAMKTMKHVLLPILMASTSCQAQTTEQVRKELQRQGVPHQEIVLAQVRHETGNFKSHLCRVNKNLFGIKHGGKYATYRNWRESIADYKKRISSRYSGGDYYAFLRRIGYAEDPAYLRKVRHIEATSK